MLWQGKLSTRSCKSLWQAQEQHWFFAEVISTPAWPRNRTTAQVSLQATKQGQKRPRPWKGSHCSPWRPSQPAQLGAPAGHVLQHWVVPCLQEWGAPTQSHHPGTETGINNRGHISAHHTEGKPQPTENTKALILATAAPHMSWSKEKSKLGTQRKDGKRGQWRIIWFHWIS